VLHSKDSYIFESVHETTYLRTQSDESKQIVPFNSARNSLKIYQVFRFVEIFGCSVPSVIARRHLTKHCTYLNAKNSIFSFNSLYAERLRLSLDLVAYTYQYSTIYLAKTILFGTHHLLKSYVILLLKLQYFLIFCC